MDNSVIQMFYGKRVCVSMIDRHGVEPRYSKATIIHAGDVWLNVSYDDGINQLIRISEIESITEMDGGKRG